MATSWWDDFSNNLATDLAPLIALFGESPTKQYLSECLNFTDILIFSTAPIGIITVVISAIRVRGSPSLRAFIGRAQEGGGNAEAELCSSTSRDVCELYNNGGIARVFGRPKLLEVVLDHHPGASDFYKDSEEKPGSAGIYSFREYVSVLKRKRGLQGSFRKNGGDSKSQQSITAADTSGQKDATKNKKDGQDGTESRDWEEITKHHPHRNSQDLEADSKHDENPEAEDFAPNPNLSLNVGIKKHSQGLFAAAAISGVVLQSAVLVWAAVARYKLLGRFVRDDPTDRYAVPVTIIGTVLLALGVGLCAFLIESSTKERVFQRKEMSIQSHMYWLQPGNQYVGDQAFDSFAYSDREAPLTTYISSKRELESNTKRHGGPDATKLDETKQFWLVWAAIILTTFGFIMQFLGLRACHSSVAVAQLGVMLVMSIVRALLRTRRMKQEDNCLSDRPDVYLGHELDWLALYMDIGDKAGSPSKSKNTRPMRHWKVPFSAMVIPSRDAKLFQNLRPESGKCQPTQNLTEEHNLPTSSIPDANEPPDTATDTKSVRPDVQEDMIGFKTDSDEALKWLKRQYAPGSAQAGEGLPHELARRFLYRSRLARMTSDWSDDYIATRDISRRLARAITETANILTFSSVLKDEWKDVKKFYWPIEGQLSRSSETFGQKDGHNHVYLALTRAQPDLQSCTWSIDESELEAVLGLWAWTLREEIAKPVSDRPGIFRVLTTESSNVYSVSLWREPGGTPIRKVTNDTLSKISRLPLLLCGLHKFHQSSRTEVRKAKSTDPQVHELELYSLQLKETIPEVCAQELYSLFFLLMLKAAVEDIGGKTTIREGFRDISLTNTTIARVQQAFTDSGLGSTESAFACTIPALILSHRLPSVLSILVDVQKTAEQNIKDKEWSKAELLLQWALNQCAKDVATNDLDFTINFENLQRVLVLATCELYRKSLLTQGSIELGIQKFDKLMRTGLTPNQQNLTLVARSIDPSSESEPSPVEPHDTLATTIKHYQMAALRLKNQVLDQPAGNPVPGLLFPSTVKETEIREALEKQDLKETLYLISRLENENRKIKLNQCLSLASRHGWYTVVQALIELGTDFDSRDDTDSTAFTYAVRGGDWNVVEYLLGRGFYPNFMDNQFRSPLSYAAEKGFILIVKRLLDDQRVSADSKDRKGCTPLWEAAKEGHESVVKLLLDKGANVNVGGGGDGTALYTASARGYKRVVQLLVDNGADVNAQSGEYCNALQAASGGAHQQVAELLLDRGANVNAQGGKYGNALYAASEIGHEQIARLLVTKGADVNARGGQHGNALYAALKGAHEPVAMLLIEQGADVNAGNGTILQVASKRGYRQIVKLLLDRGANVNAKVQDKDNALQAASGEGHEQVVQLLLDKGANVNAEVRGYYGNALYAASHGGHKQVVELLLDRGANVNARGAKGDNALHAASGGGHEQVVELLLDRGADVNARSVYYGDALQAASSGGHEQVVKLLLDKGADVNAKSGEYNNALQIASGQGHEQVVKLLLDKGAEVNAQGGYFGNALYAASERGHEQIVKLLLNKGADFTAQGGYYGNALQAASGRGHEQAVKLLLDKGANVNTQGGEYGNALQAASSGGCERIVELLLDAGANVTAQGGSYGNALQAASSGGYDRIVKLLLDAGANVNAQGGVHGNALQAASSRGHERVVELLLEKGADVNARGAGSNALREASSGGYEQVMKLLIDKGADVNTLDEEIGNSFA